MFLSTLTFTYDAFSRLTTETQTISGSTKAITYTYDNNSNITSLTHPDGQIQSYTYDALNRNTTVGYSGETLATYTYSGLTLTTLGYLNGRTTNYTYDALQRLSGISGGTGITSYNYTYDDSSSIISDGTKSYTYDPLNRLISATPTNTGSINQNTESYTYDKIGNRKMDINSSYTTNTLDQYMSQSGGVNKSYTYDNNGNLKSDGTNSYTYDYNNRLIQVNQGTGIIAQYQYDILGRRIQKITPTEVITYIYAGDNIIQEIRTLGGGTNNPLTLKKTYINGLGTDNLIAYDNEESTNQDKISFCQTRVLPYSTEFQSYGYQSIIDDCTTTMSSSTGITTNRYYYHTNHLGSIIGISDNSGNVLQSYAYDSFGKAYIITGTGITSISTTTNLYGNTRLYTGREYDVEVLLYFNRARYYNPDTGRFISRDPIGQNDQINLYTYVANSPMNYVDRDGKEKKFVMYFDEYLDLTATILNPAFLLLDSNTQNTLLQARDAAEIKAKQIHYNRNLLNTNLPSTANEAKELKWEQLSEKESRYHQNTAADGKPNDKFIDQEGHKEAVYGNNGKIINDPRDIGTYNFFNPHEIRNHLIYDVIPYWNWSNSPDDQTSLFTRVTGF